MRRQGADFLANFWRTLQPALDGVVDLVVHRGNLLFRSRAPLPFAMEPSSSGDVKPAIEWIPLPGRPMGDIVLNSTSPTSAFENQLRRRLSSIHRDAVVRVLLDVPLDASNSPRAECAETKSPITT